MKTLLLWTIGLLLALVAGAGLLRLEPHFDPRVLLDLSSEVVAESEEIEGLFGESPAPAVFVLEAPNILTPSALGRIHALSLAAAVHGRVLSLTHAALPHIGEGDLEATLSLIESAPAAFPRGLAGLGERLGGELAVSPIAASEDALDADAVEALVAAAPHAEGTLIDAENRHALVLAYGVSPEQAKELSHRYDANVTGIALLQEHIESGMRSEGALLIGVALLLTMLLLALAFRHHVPITLPLLAAGFTLLLVMGTLGWITGELTLLTAILPPVLLTICVGDALHLMARFAEERTDASADEAARRTREAMWRACFATSLTTAIGFGSLVFARTPALRLFGAMSAVGVMVAFFVVVGLLPALLARSSWRGRAFDGARHASIASWCASRRKLVIAISILVFAMAAFGTTRLQEGTRLLSPFDEDEALAETARIVDGGLGGVRQMDWVLRGDPLSPETLERCSSLSAWAREQQSVTAIHSPCALLDGAWASMSDAQRPPQSNAPLAQLIAPALTGLIAPDALRIRVGLRDVSADEMSALGRGARSRGADLLGGEAWHAGVGLSSLQYDLVASLGLAFVGIFGVILLLFGPRFTIAASLPNVLPLACVLGWMGLRDFPLDVGTAMVFAVTLGLVVDGTLHVLARFREGSSLRATYRHAGPAVVVGGALLLVGFASLFFSSLRPLQQFAELASVALIAGVMAELTLLPAMLHSVSRQS